jgi:Uma2 family endonuclease
MLQTLTKPLTTLEEFLKLPETKPASEYIDNQIIQKHKAQDLRSLEFYSPMADQYDAVNAFMQLLMEKKC